MKQQTIFKSLFSLRSIPALGLAGAVLLTGCAADSDDSASTSTSTAAPTSASSSVASDAATGSVASSAPANSIMPPTTAGASSSAPALAKVGNETIDWEPCGQLECGSVTVPVDRNDESLGTLEIAVNVRRATNPDERIGYLFVNPGGPGGSGVEMAFGAVPTLGEEVTNRFDVVGFDPRGVGQSEPTFECGDDGEQLDLVKNLTLPLDDSETAAGEQAAKLCADSMGPVASRLGSSFVADDMDAIRVALGADKINFIGYSYGSALGTWYASAYPTHVRSMVLDGADEVVSDNSTLQVRIEDALAESSGFEEQLSEALAACNTADCPIYNDGDPTAAYLEALDNQELVTAETSNPNTTAMGVISFLYSEDDWPMLWQAIADLGDGDPTAIVESAKFQQPDDGANFTETVNCLDGWAIHPDDDRDSQLADADAIEAAVREQLPLLTAIHIADVGVCPFFDVLNPPAAPVTLDGADVPILVIGNHSDPVTAFSESERLATEVLSNGYLVDTDHYKHTVFPENDCVNAHVYALLFDERLPEAHVVTCERQEPEALPPLEDLAAVCANAVSMEDRRPTPEQADEICERFVESVANRFTEAELDQFASGDLDQEVGETIATMYEEAVDAVLGS